MRSGLVTLELSDPHAEVLIVTSGWPHDGDPAYGIFSKREVEALRRTGVRCEVLFIHGYRSRLAYLVAALQLLSANLTRRHRIVHAHGGEAAVVASLYRRAPLVVSYWGDDLLGTIGEDGSVSIASRIRRRALRVHSRLASGTMTQSHAMEAALPGATRARNTVVPTGIDARLFRPLDRMEARRELGWDLDDPIALFASDPSVACKRLGLAELAIERARRSIPAARLQVLYKRPPHEVPVAMSAADCLLFTSASEGSPNVVKEAAFCGLPVVTTRVGDVEEVMRGVEPSWVCGDSVEELADALVACLTARPRSNGPEVSTSFSAERIAQCVSAKYAHVAAGGWSPQQGGLSGGSR
jgi:glycosyltransferase involved in cell wall biosynthesis